MARKFLKDDYSDGHEVKEDKKKKKLKQKYISPPKQSNGRVDKERVKAMFLESQHMEWGPFADANGWDPVRTRSNFPVDLWKQEKKNKFVDRQKEEMAAAFADLKTGWSKDFAKTMKHYPQLADAYTAIVTERLKDYQNLMRMKAQGDDRKWNQVTNGELVQLGMALKLATETKHKSMLLNDFNLKVREIEEKPIDGTTENPMVASFQVELIGGENTTSREIETRLATYYGQMAALEYRNEDEADG